MDDLSTKQKILMAARKLFVDYGFSGTSLGKIAKLAEVNQSLISHHFENKEGLWLAVKKNIAQDAEQKSKVLPSIDLPFKNFLRELIKKSISFYRNHPDIIRMINWQRLEYDNKPAIGVTLSEESEAWIDAFKHYQQQGDIKAGLKVEFIITMILSITSSAALDQNIFINNSKDQISYIDFCVMQLQKAFK